MAFLFAFSLSFFSIGLLFNQSHLVSNPVCFFHFFISYENCLTIAIFSILLRDQRRSEDFRRPGQGSNFGAPILSSSKSDDLFWFFSRKSINFGRLVLHRRI